MNSETVDCPICSQKVIAREINDHLDRNCKESTSSSSSNTKASGPSTRRSSAIHPLFQTSKKSNPGTKPEMQQSHIVRKRGNDANVEYAPAKRSKTSYDLSPITPLAERLRPSTLSEFVGQSHLTRPDSLLMNAIRNDSLGSLIFWGPPGCGKTTLARLIAQETKSIFKELSATVVGINDVRLVFEEAKNAFRLTGRKTTLFLDEVHRFNKSQQDVFLPFVEQGHIQLIGATTENPSFKLTGALLSRCRVFTLDRLADDAIEEIIRNAIHRLTSKIDIDESTLLSSPASFPETSDISDSRLTSSPSEISTPKSPLSASQQKDVPFPTFPHISYKVLRSIISLSTGDARCALSLLDLAKSAPLDVSESQLVEELRRSVSSSYDRSGDGRYDMISALHKSVRGSNVDAAMYWLARMLGAGEDPLYIARRMVVCASEDVGLADAQALPLAIAGLQACQMIGMPECRINLAHVVAYLAEAPKSTRSYEAYNRALAVAQTDMTLPVPLRIRNAPTHLMRDLGYAEGYRYNPDYTHPVYNEYMPSQLEGHLFMRKPDDLSGKLWDESALCEWETKVNGGQRWEGRKHTSSDVTVAP